MTKVAYKPLVAETIGRTVSCYTLARMLNEIESNSLTKKVVTNINKHFELVRKISLSIHNPDVRKEVGKILLLQVKHFKVDITCPTHIENVIRNVKYAYIKDMLISDCPLNYQRRLREHEVGDYLSGMNFAFNE